MSFSISPLYVLSGLLTMMRCTTSPWLPRSQTVSRSSSAEAWQWRPSTTQGVSSSAWASPGTKQRLSTIILKLVVWTPHWQMNFTPYLFVKEFRPQCISTKIIHANTVQCVYLYSSYDWLFCTSQITLSWVFYRWHVTSFLNLYAVKFCTLKPRHKVKLLQESSEVHLLPYRLA